MELTQRIATYTPNKYNPYYWWRRFKPRQTLHPYRSLQEKIVNGDYETSDYHWWWLHEKQLEQEALLKEKSVEKQHELRGIFGERKRRLLADFQKDEAKILEEMYKDFSVAFRMTREQVEEEMLQFDGGLAEFHSYLQDKKLKNQINNGK